jgi:large subunit ribosomal protein L43
MNGQKKEVDVRNLEKNQILKKVDLLRNDNGEKLKRETKPVTSDNENIRGIWSGIHGTKVSIGLEGLPPSTKLRRK